jgi:SAM-dependent methyltransferase
MNFFGFTTAAERYAAGRPYFHPFVVRHIKDFLSLKGLLSRALDVGCGTGLSALALKEVAARIVGVDAASSMLRQARADARIAYAVALAERLPFGASEFDLLTLSQVCHWLNREQFFAEAHRVLCVGGWLVIYDAYFSATEAEDTEFQAWHRDVYLARYPSPARSWFSLSPDDAEAAGFRLCKAERLQHAVGFTLEGLAAYLLTQSNIIAAVEDGAEEITEVRRWLTASLSPFFAGHTEVSFPFNTPIWFLQTASDD